MKGNLGMDDFSPLPQKQCAGPCKQFLPATSEFFSKNKTRKDGLQTLCKTCTKAYKKQHYQAHKAEINEKNKVYREAHKEQWQEYIKQYAEIHKEPLREYHQQYYESHKEQAIEKSRQRYETHREQILEQTKRYALAHREQVLERKRHYWSSHRERLVAQKRQHYKTHIEQMRERSKEYYETHKKQHYEYAKQYRKTERGRLIRRANWHKREAQKKAIGGSYTAQNIQDQYRRQKAKCYWCHKRLNKYHIDHVIPLSRGGSNDPSNLVIACPGCNTSRQARLPHEWPEGGRLL